MRASYIVLLGLVGCGAPSSDACNCAPGTEDSGRATDGADGTDGGDGTDGADGTDGTDDSWAPPWSDAPCDGLSVESSPYAGQVERFRYQASLAPPDPGQLVVVGSSSIRRWERAAEDLAPWGVVQRGLGGAWMTDIAGFADTLVFASEPAAVVVFAGTNDLAGGSTVDEVDARTRCLLEQTWSTLGRAPVLYLGVTPTPARWDDWSRAAELNARMADLAADHPGVVYVDTPTAFLQTGSPPDAALFDADGLHLSPAGYALWTAVLTEALRDTLPQRAAPSPAALPAGTRLRVDLGPANAADGAVTPDAGWSSWHDAAVGGEQVLAGEVKGDLVTTTGEPTGVRLLITGGFLSYGFANGGLLDPDPALLGAFAVPEATGDFFYVDGADNPGRLALTGLDPDGRYALHLFASRDWCSEDRVTRYTASGGHGLATGTLQTSGWALSADGSACGNDHTVVTLEDLQPDAWGQLHLDVAAESGSYAYLSALELEVQ